jgi:hypothetical protein
MSYSMQHEGDPKAIWTIKFSLRLSISKEFRWRTDGNINQIFLYHNQHCSSNPTWNYRFYQYPDFAVIAKFRYFKITLSQTWVPPLNQLKCIIFWKNVDSQVKISHSVSLKLCPIQFFMIMSNSKWSQFILKMFLDLLTLFKQWSIVLASKLWTYQMISKLWYEI